MAAALLWALPQQFTRICGDNLPRRVHRSFRVLILLVVEFLVPPLVIHDGNVHTAADHDGDAHENDETGRHSQSTIARNGASINGGSAGTFCSRTIQPEMGAPPSLRRITSRAERSRRPAVRASRRT